MPKDNLALVIGTDKPKEEPLDEKADAMKDLGEALAAKDWTGAAMAFERAYEICASSSDVDTDSSEEDEGSAEEMRY